MTFTIGPKSKVFLALTGASFLLDAIWILYKKYVERKEKKEKCLDAPLTEVLFFNETNCRSHLYLGNSPCELPNCQTIYLK